MEVRVSVEIIVKEKDVEGVSSLLFEQNIATSTDIVLAGAEMVLEDDMIKKNSAAAVGTIVRLTAVQPIGAAAARLVEAAISKMGGETGGWFIRIQLSEP